MLPSADGRGAQQIPALKGKATPGSIVGDGDTGQAWGAPQFDSDPIPVCQRPYAHHAWGRSGLGQDDVRDWRRI